MRFVLTKKNITIIVSLSVFFLACLGTGLFLLLRQKDRSLIYNIDKHTDVIDWCETKIESDVLTVSCKALLFSISTNEDKSSCFEVQIITKGKEVKDLTICDSVDNLSYTNEILAYKKFMPIDVNFEYLKTKGLDNYSFSSASFEAMDDNYIYDLINIDLADLINTPIDTTTIANNMDYCPAPEALPSYITETNRLDYTKFYNENRDINYKTQYDSGQENNTLTMLYPCDNSSITASKCDLSLLNYQLGDVNTIKNFSPESILWGNELSFVDTLILRKVSDLTFEYSNDLENTTDINEITEISGMQMQLNETAYCSVYNLYAQLYLGSDIRKGSEMMNSYFIISSHGKEITSRVCLNIIADDRYDEMGTYLKIYYSNINSHNVLAIYNKCLNLTQVFHE